MIKKYLKDTLSAIDKTENIFEYAKRIDESKKISKKFTEWFNKLNYENKTNTVSDGYFKLIEVKLNRLLKDHGGAWLKDV